MTNKEALGVEELLREISCSLQVEKADPKGNVWVIYLPFQDYEGKWFHFYMFKVKGSKKITFSDGGVLVKAIQSGGQARMNAIQKLLNSFGLSLMEDLSVMDITKRPLRVRAQSFLQAYCAVDGMIRIWKISQEEVQNAVQSARRSSGDDESLRAAGTETA